MVKKISPVGMVAYTRPLLNRRLIEYADRFDREKQWGAAVNKHLPRRAVLKSLAGGFSAFVSGLFPFGASGADESANAVQRSWSYEGVTGPEHWSELSPNYASCQFGVAQSPIDLVDSIKLNSPNTLILDYRPVTAHVARDSQNLKVMLDPGCQVMLYEEIYVLEGFRFCRPSEHLLSGRALEMELQFVHRAKNGDLAMVAVFVRQGATNKALDTILANLPVKAAGTDAAPVFPLNPIDVLPQMKDKDEHRAFYNYAGSLSSPPCTEGIRWVVFKNPVEASPQQIRDFAAQFPRNARPVNKINARILLEYGGESASINP